MPDPKLSLKEWRNFDANAGCPLLLDVKNYINLMQEISSLECYKPERSKHKVNILTPNLEGI